MSGATATIWHNGALYNADEPLLTAQDRGAALGDGLFETVKVYGGLPCHLDQHWARLGTSAIALSITVPFDQGTMANALARLAKANSINTGAARIVLSRGIGPRGLALPKIEDPQITITISAGLPHFAEPPILGLSRIRRNPWSITSQHKALSYIDNIAARLQQDSAKTRDEVVMLDCAGHLASASVANIFWCDADGLHTPALSCAILPGTMRARVLKAAERLGLQHNEGIYTPKALQHAHSAFMTNALIGIQSLGGVDFGSSGTTEFQPEHAIITALRKAL